MNNYLPIDEIYNMDCVEFLKHVADCSVDLAIIDPPYNMSKASWDTFSTHDEFMQFTQTWIDALIPKLKKTGSVYIFNTPFNCAFILQYLLQCGLLFQNWITWDKRDGLGTSTKKYANGQESILFFTKSNKYTFNYDDIRIPYESTERIEAAKTKGILKNGKRWFPNPKGKLCGEVWHISSQRHKNKVNGKIQKQPHITPKPEEMIKRMILASSNKNDLILDCFVGSGTTAIVAKKLKRHYICADQSSAYVELTKNKLKEIQ